ncbi:MAG TPA: GGDEF domain-containing protein [Tepidisphaeraceae bacterium]|nr:GGDEF domain-containing protein [Tepidisphaeraceae bacterium]
MTAVATNEQLISRIKQCPTLPSLPAIAMQVLDLAQREEVDIAEIARVISKDPALSSKILRTVNSSFYGRAQSISTISHALVILGLQSVKTLVLGFSLVTNLTKNKSKGFKHLTYWRRSIYAATAARTIANKLNVVQQEEVFLAALLQDIGMLVLDQVLGEEYGAIHEEATSHHNLVEVERTKLGMTHADVAGILAEMWKLPPLLRVPMMSHHVVGEVTDPALKKLAELVYLSGRCADVFVDENAAEAIADVRKFVLATYQISEADCDAMLDDICKRTKEIAPMFEISLGSVDSYEAVLKKANEALVELTLRSQQQASTLQVQNQELKKQATTDGLTALANRATFDEFLAEQFKLAEETGKPMALLMLDIDKFKSVNDTHGHQAGDAVIKYIGKLLKTAARVQDLAARYGGEEMALVLPGTTRNTAAAIAETICRAVATKPIPVGDGKTLPITASLGVASVEPGGLLTQPAHVIKAADLALYTAKKSGRNCVKVFSPPSGKPAQIRPAA